MSDDIPTEKATAFDEAVNLISSTTVLAVLYTFSLVLYYHCVRLSYYQARGRDRKIQKGTIFTLGLTSLMITCATVDIVLINRYMELIYVDYANVPGGPLGLKAQLHALTIGIIDLVVALVEEIVATGVLVWRVWVIWKATRYFVPIVTLSVALYLAYTASYTMNIVVAFSNFVPNFATTPRLSKVVVIMTLGLSSASTVFMSSIIVLRLMIARWQLVRVMGRTEAAGQYLSIAAMLVESYALMTIWTVANLINYIVRNAHSGAFFNNLVVQIRVLSYLLVAYRVFSGRAWNQQTGQELSTVRWNRPYDETTSSTINDNDPGIELEMKPSALSWRADV